MEIRSLHHLYSIPTYKIMQNKATKTICHGQVFQLLWAAKCFVQQFSTAHFPCLHEHFEYHQITNWKRFWDCDAKRSVFWYRKPFSKPTPVALYTIFNLDWRKIGSNQDRISRGCAFCTHSLRLCRPWMWSKPETCMCVHAEISWKLLVRLDRLRRFVSVSCPLCKQMHTLI